MLSAKRFELVCSIAIFLALGGCGGGSTGSSNPPPQSVTVTVSSSNSTVLLGNTQQFTASVSGTSNTAVNWSVNGVPGGNPKVGTISSAGLYTAPGDLPNSASVTIQATSQADGSASGSASLKITSDIAVSVSTVPAGVQSVSAGATLQLQASVSSAGHPDQTVDWSVNGVANGNSSVGSISVTGTNTATYSAPSNLSSPLSITVAATSIADTTRQSSVAFQDILASLSVTSVSNTSPVPLTPLYVSTTGLNLSSPVTVQFSNASGFSVSQTPIRVAADGAIVVASPLYLNPASGQIGPGTVSLVLTQGSASSAPVNLNIQDLPSASSYGTQPGQISHAVLVMEALLLGRRINELQAFQIVPGTTVDTSQAQANLATLLNAVIKARSDVDQLTQDNSVVISNGTLPDGTPVQFDQVSLDLMDRINAVFLTQTIASLAPAAVSPALRPASLAPLKLQKLFPVPGRQPRPPRERIHAPVSSLGQDAITEHGAASLSQSSQLSSLLAVMQSIQGASTISAGAVSAANAQGLADQVFALVGGTASLGAVFETLPTKNANQLLGAVGAVVSDLRLAGECWGDLGAYIAGLATHNQSLVNVAVDAMNSVPRVELYTALGDLTLAFPELQAIEALQPVSTVLGFIESAHGIDAGLQNADQTALAVANSFPVPALDTQGIAFVTGNVNVPTNQGVFAPQSEIVLSSNGDSVSGMADPGGNYELFVPLQASPFNYANTDVTIVDPISQTVLGSVVVDLSSLNTSNPLQIPPIQGSACLNTDFDGDDPDCD